MSIYVGEPRIISISDMQGPAPDGFHVPLISEWQSLCGILTSTFGLANNATTIGTYLKMPMAGSRSYSTTRVGNAGTWGYYWSSTPYNTQDSYYFDFSSSDIKLQLYSSRGNGYSVRCFKNIPVIPTSSWTTLHQGSGSAGVFYNATAGLISVSGDGNTWVTIADKNLGATTVFNQGDTVNDDNSGYFYQWGNNYGFPHSGSLESASYRQVDASNYGPGNYYESSTWITTKPRDTSNNNNLWGGVSQGTSTTTSGIKNLYIGANEAKEVYVGATKIRPKAEPITTRGIYWSSQLGLISLSSDGSTWTTIQDKNLGATTVWNNGDTLTDNNCGYFFQWGNNYGFPHSGDVTTSRTTVNAGTYGPGNYYNSSTYIIGNIQSWDTSGNANLWGDTTNTNAARQGPCIAGYHVPTKTEYQGIVSILSALYNYGDTGLTPSDSIPICLKMPRAGYRNHFAGLDSVGSQGAYWTSTSSGTAAPGLTFTSSTYGTGNGRKMYGYCIRGFANTSVQPDTSWTKIV